MNESEQEINGREVKIFDENDVEKLDFVSFLIDWNKRLEMRVPAHHIRMAKWLESIYYSDKKRGLLMSFRSSGKSTIVGVFCAWLLYRNPNLRILVVAADTTLARKMVRNVRRIIELNSLLQNICPKKKSGRREVLLCNVLWSCGIRLCLRWGLCPMPLEAVPMSLFMMMWRCRKRVRHINVG